MFSFCSTKSRGEFCHALRNCSCSTCFLHVSTFGSFDDQRTRNPDNRENRPARLSSFRHRRAANGKNHRAGVGDGRGQDLLHSRPRPGARHIAGFREYQHRLFRALRQARIAEQQGPSPLGQIHHARLRRLGRNHRQAEGQSQSYTNWPRPRRVAGSQLCAMTSARLLKMRQKKLRFKHPGSGVRDRTDTQSA